MTRYEMYTDAACQGNPGPSGAGVVIYKDSKEWFSASRYLGNKTVNEAEYLSLIHGLLIAEMYGIRDIKINMDSMIVVQQVNKNWKVNADNLKPYYKKVSSILKNFDRIELGHVKREYNERADELSRINERR